MKSTISKVIAAVICVVVVCGCFYLVSEQNKSSVEDNVQLTNVQKITTRNLETDYPATPREVVKLFNKILKCYYGETWTDQEIKDLTSQAWNLFDPKLQEQNPKENYLISVQLEVQDYKERGRSISQTSVCDSNEVKFIQDGEDEIAYVSASYFIKDGKQHNNTHEMYVLRKDEEGRWRILVFYQIEEEQTQDD